MQLCSFTLEQQAETFRASRDFDLERAVQRMSKAFSSSDVVGISEEQRVGDVEKL